MPRLACVDDFDPVVEAHAVVAEIDADARVRMDAVAEDGVADVPGGHDHAGAGVVRDQVRIARVGPADDVVGRLEPDPWPAVAEGAGTAGGRAVLLPRMMVLSPRWCQDARIPGGIGADDVVDDLVAGGQPADAVWPLAIAAVPAASSRCSCRDDEFRGSWP